VPRGDLSFQLGVTDLPLAQLDALLPASLRGLTGAATGTVKGKAPFEQLQDPARWVAEASLKSAEAGWLGLRVTGLDVGARLDKGILVVTGLRGRLEKATLSGSATLRLAAPVAVESRLTLDGFDLTALDRLAPAVRLLVEVSGTVRLEANVKGPFDVRGLSASGSLSASRLAVDKLRLESVSFAWRASAAALVAEKVRARLYGGEVTGSATFPLREGESGKVDLALNGVEAGQAVKALTDAALSVEGKLSGTVAATITEPKGKGGARAVAADVDFKAPGLRVQRINAERLSGKVHCRNGEVDYELQADALGGKIKLDGRLPPAAPKKGREPEGHLRLRGVRVPRLLVGLGAAEGPAALRDAVLDLDLPFRLVGPRRVPVGVALVAVRGLRGGDPTFPRELRLSVELREEGVFLPRTIVRLGGGSVSVRALYRYQAVSVILVTISRVESGALAAFLPGFQDTVRGPVSGDLRVTGTREWRGSGSLRMALGRVLSVEVSDWTLPLSFTFLPISGHGQFTVLDSAARVGHGRAVLRASALWGGGLGARVSGNLRLYDARLGSLVAATSDLSRYAEGRLSGEVDFEGSNVRSANDLNATIQARLEQAQALQLPVFREIAPYLGRGRQATFQNGDLRATLGGGVVRVSRLELTGNTLELFASGSVTLQGGLDLEVTARTSPALLRDYLILATLARSVPAIGPVPVSLLARVTLLLANRVVHLRVTGSVSSPQVRVEPLRLLSDEAARYFLLRVALPAAVPTSGAGL
jgi:translocation and assembly module TamB